MKHAGVTKIPKLKIVGIMALAFIVICVLGAISGQKKSDRQEKQPSSEDTQDTQVVHSYNLSKDASFQGVSIKIDPSWDIDTPKECDFYVRVDDVKSDIHIQTATHGQMNDLEPAWKEFLNSNESINYFDKWSDEGIDYASGIVKRKESNCWLFLGNEKSSGKGFLVVFLLYKSDWSELDQKKLVNDVTGSLVYDPSETTIDHRDWLAANKNNNKSNSDTKSSESSKPDQILPPTPTVSQQNALKKAKSYINSMAFSYTGLIKQLEYNKFSEEDATYGADNCGADWNEQAAKKAASYLKSMAFSRGSLIDQLVYNGFTQEQAAYGADSVGL